MGTILDPQHTHPGIFILESPPPPPRMNYAATQIRDSATLRWTNILIIICCLFHTSCLIMDKGQIHRQGHLSAISKRELTRTKTKLNLTTCNLLSERTGQCIGFKFWRSIPSIGTWRYLCHWLYICKSSCAHY